MPFQLYPYKPIGGINGEDAEDSLGEFEARDANNFLFEGKQFLTRPGLTSYIARESAAVNNPFPTDLRYIRSYRILNFPLKRFHTIAIGADNKLYLLMNSLIGPDAIFIEMAGAGTTFDVKSPRQELMTSDMVNAVVLMGNNTGGLLRYDPIGIVAYTIIADAPYRYVTAYGFRAIGAYKITVGFENPRLVGWSESGNETNWTTADSGSSNLVDCADDITGLGVSHNVLVVARRNGFHLGVPTFTSSPVFRFELWGKDVSGCPYPSTFTSHDNKFYYCSQDNVCTFDLQQITPIGNQIRTELFALLTAGYRYRGFVSRVTGPKPRIQYHLVPFARVKDYTGSDLPIGASHFIFDIQDQVWSKHSYGSAIYGGFNFIYSEQLETPTLFTTNNLKLWDPMVAIEQPAILTGRSILLGQEDYNATLRKLLLKYRNYGEIKVTLKGRCLQETTVVENSTQISIGKDPTDGKLMKAWAPLALSGQNFEITLETPAGKAFAGTFFGLKADMAGEFKGNAGI